MCFHGNRSLDQIDVKMMIANRFGEEKIESEAFSILKGDEFISQKMLVKSTDSIKVVELQCNGKITVDCNIKVPCISSVLKALGLNDGLQFTFQLDIEPSMLL